MSRAEFDEESRCSNDVLVEIPRGALRVEDAATPLRLSLVIPTYNEAANLRPLLERLTATLGGLRAHRRRRRQSRSNVVGCGRADEVVSLVQGHAEAWRARLGDRRHSELASGPR